MNAVTEKQNTNLAVVSDEILQDYLKSLGNNLPEQHIKKFIHIAKAFNLNPFTREIYGIPYGNNFNIIVGYEVYIKRAERSGKLAGWKAWTEGSLKDGDLKGCIEIKRKDWDEPFYHEVYFDEYNQNNSMWKSKPRTMIKKVAIAQGFRLAFPDELAGMPYTADEIEIETEPVTQQQQPQKQEQKADTKLLLVAELNKLGVPSQALNAFASFCSSNGYDLKKEGVKQELLNNKQKLNEIVASFIESQNKEGQDANYEVIVE